MLFVQEKVGWVVGALVLVMACLVSVPVNAQAADPNQPPSKTKRLLSAGSRLSENPKPVTMIELGSVRCVPCKLMQPVMREIELEYGERVKVVFHDVWTAEGRPFADQFHIQGIPTQIFLDRTGKEFFRHTGFFPKAEIIKILQKQGV